MKTLFHRNTRIAAFAAVVIVGLTGLTLDRAHVGALPRGTIEVGELEAVQIGGIVTATLPAVEVIGARDARLADVAVGADAQG